MPGDNNPELTRWGRRPYADVAARNILNDESERIARNQPDHVDDPSDLTLADILRERYRRRSDSGQVRTLTEIKSHGLTFEETVCWYFYRFAGYDLEEIHRTVRGTNPGGDPSHHRNSLRNIQRILKSAATQLPDEEPAEVPDMIDVETGSEPATQG